MQFKYVAQKKQLDVKNVFPAAKQNDELIPSPARCLLLGASNSGKTNIILALVTDPLGVKFEHLFLFCRTLQQEKYQFLLEVLKDIVSVHASETVEPIDFPENSLIIFDDCQLEDQNFIKRVFAYGRHKNISILYAAQSYPHLDKLIIRTNANFFVVLRQDLKSLRHIYEDHVAPDMSFPDLLKLCQNSWKRDFGFFVIDKQSPINMGRYRDGFSRFITCSN